MPSVTLPAKADSFAALRNDKFKVGMFKVGMAHRFMVGKDKSMTVRTTRCRQGYDKLLADDDKVLPRLRTVDAAVVEVHNMQPPCASSAYLHAIR